MPKPTHPQVTDFQTRVYTLLQQIPPGRICSYAALARALGSSPRAVGGALRNNPFAPEVPCHRCIASTGFIGGFKGDWEKVPSGQNQESKLELLKGEGVEFDEKGMLVDRGLWWDGFRVGEVRFGKQHE
ncbi:DNA binding methylated-DNA--cysteine S-methyltransferase [Corynespora cassiicola Philippines]|uniref:Methylated-DNA--protein-cysteine methyltransferase n=1 Tax=Corynespora cassiicola Philippines TaxID=1448308 RepID=A0A2T2NCT0_CORCC|nr:DNA binding methylated-DNA--cysteine S-methyltransferase [Corynespora cassiicola Philippines]